ncbi:MAG: Holliday junction resolvase RuvX [Myxococcota bacterium]
MRVLGIDLGSKRIGLAISDQDGVVAFPAGVIESRGRKRDLAALRSLVRERAIARAVVGVPLHMSGRRGPEAEAAIAFASDLARAAGIPVDTLDERWTSVEAERMLRSTERGRRAVKARSGAVDESAAAILLRTYLDLRSAGSGQPSGAPPEGRPIDDEDREDRDVR